MINTIHDRRFGELPESIRRHVRRVEIDAIYEHAGKGLNISLVCYGEGTNKLVRECFTEVACSEEQNWRYEGFCRGTCKRKKYEFGIWGRPEFPLMCRTCTQFPCTGM